LGEFVHHFEDVLDHYRSTKEEVEDHHLELFVGSVDVIKEVMECELDALTELPADYAGCLEKIKALIASKKPGGVPAVVEEAPRILNDLAAEFALSGEEQMDNSIANAIKKLQASQSEGPNLYRVDLTLDEDCYKRGFDHLLFLKLLGEKAASLESFFDMEPIRPLEGFTCDENVLKHVCAVVLTPQTLEEVEENFEFLFDHEYNVTRIEQPRIEKVIEEVKPVVMEEKDQEVEKGSVKSAPAASATNATAPKSTIRIDTFKLDELFDSVGELVIAQNFIAQNEKIRSIEDESISRAIETLSKITKRIQDRVMSLRMVAIRDTFDKMKRVVRDTSKKTGKRASSSCAGRRDRDR
jgi:two-component system chemotaxis sensor kinase CheA